MSDIDNDSNEAEQEAEFQKCIVGTDKETLWWAHYRLLNAVHAARYAADVDKNKDQQTILNVIGFTADHWQPQLPGMPSYEDVAKDCRADDDHHELTYLGERLGVYITGDEFMTKGGGRG
jgi:hypothetical protein